MGLSLIEKESNGDEFAKCRPLVKSSERLDDEAEMLDDDFEKYELFKSEKVVEIRYLSDKISKIEKIEGKMSDWIDLRSAEDVNLNQGEFKLIPLGVAMKLPMGYEAHVVPRSSTFKNFGIIQTNGIGIIDNSYCGNGDQWYMPVLAMRDTHISLNDRICQFRIMPVQGNIELSEVESLGNVDRGGIGSTGVK